ncbi:MAG: succinate dehydrogenase assembly factor 2 [Pseudomonadales bacterium]
MISEIDYKQLCWASRRGMLELDLILMPFVENRFRELSTEDQQRYIQLVEGEDNDMFAWLLGRERPENPELAIIVDQIITYSRGQ